MTATASRPPAAPSLTRPGGRRRRVGRLERPLLLAGLILVTAHLLDLALSGPRTTVTGVLAIVAAPVAWAAAQPYVTRPSAASPARGRPRRCSASCPVSHRGRCCSSRAAVPTGEIPTDAAYRDATGPTTELWTIPDAAHIGGLRSHTVEYERRTIGFLDRALRVGGRREADS
jgi:hypothetical protein